MSLATRFQEKWKYSGEKGCWEWVAAKRNGYGVIRNGEQVNYAHRVSYQMFRRDLTKGEILLHACDNTACVNPFHLIPGSHADNVADKVSKDRHLKGATHPRSKLTETDIASIRSDNRLQKEIAAEYGISTAQISRVKNHKNWAHI